MHTIDITCGISSNFFHVRLDGMYENRHKVVVQSAHTLELENYVKLKYPYRCNGLVNVKKSLQDKMYFFSIRPDIAPNFFNF